MDMDLCFRATLSPAWFVIGLPRSRWHKFEKVFRDRPGARRAQGEIAFSEENA
jgi:hypothetical protein